MQENFRYGRIAQILTIRKAGLVGFESITNTRSGMQILALLDPLSRVAQRMAPVLKWLQQWLGPNIKVMLNPIPDLEKPPLSSYYRFVLPGIIFTGGYWWI